MFFRCGFSLVAVFFLFVWSGTISAAVPAGLLPVQSGELSAGGQRLTYRISAQQVEFFDEDLKLPFSVSSPDGFTILLGCGYSTALEALYVFKERLSPETRRYDLLLETPSGIMTLVQGAPHAFHSPLLIETTGFHVAYVDHGSAIVLVDAASGQTLQRLPSAGPVKGLYLDDEGASPRIAFRCFDGVKKAYVPRYIDISRIGSKKCRIDIVETAGRDEGTPALIAPPQPPPRAVDLVKNYKKTIGFGDSITYGFINKLPQPELGYIPRLQSKLSQEIYLDADLVSDGVPGSRTEDGVMRIESVIETHEAQNLLFHYGTNDILDVSTLPVSGILYNIEFMIDKVLEYEMTPVLSTLIPRNRIAADGIWRERAIEVSQGIRNMALEKNIPVVDLWTLFSEYPASDGGYISLMSDNVHPSEKGYQLMADEWHKILLKMEPQAPSAAALNHVSPFKAIAGWPNNEELDLHHYVIRYGYGSERLLWSKEISSPSFEFVRFPYHDLSRTLYFQVQAVDNSGSGSRFSPVQPVTFTGSTAMFKQSEKP